MSKIIATGGGDEAEDVVGALKKALAFKFNDKGLNVVFLLADSPQHGKQYHNEGEAIGDHYLDKIEIGTLEKVVK